LSGAGVTPARLLSRSAALLGAALALTGCSSPHGSAASSSTSPPTTTGSSTTVPTVPATTTTTTIPGCTGSNWALSLLGSQGAAGTFELTLGLRDTSSATCPLDGVPGVELLDSSGNPIATSEVRGGGESFTNFAPAPVSLGPGQSAYVNLGYSDVPTGGATSCPTAAAIELTPPGTSTPLRVSGRFTVCNDGTVDVSPLFGRQSPETETTAPPNG
jgi:hypothetical protein